MVDRQQTTIAELIIQTAPLVRVGKATGRYTSTGRLSGYQVEISHDGLHKHRVLSDQDLDFLRNKINSQILKWNEQWERQSAREQERSAKEQGRATAEEVSRQAQAALAECEELLRHTLQVDDRIDWEALKDKTPFSDVPRGTPGLLYDRMTGRPKGIVAIQRPPAIRSDAPDFVPAFSLLDSLFRGRKQRKIGEAEGRLKEAMRQREAQVAAIREQEARLKEALSRETATFRETEAHHLASQQKTNAEVDSMRDRYLSAGATNPEAVEHHAELVMNSSQYPDWMSIDFDLGYNPENKILIIDYMLPDKSRVPSLREVTYVSSRNEVREKLLNDRDHDALFDRVCYQIALRTIHELYEADEVAAFDAIVFNGWVEAVDSATGVMERSCILSVQANRDEFHAINLADVEPQACFKRLKGISASRLAGLAPIAPILQLDREDRRFISSREVVGGISSGTNLAEMPWEDFEHLIRELFEQEFAAAGAEVRVTQASRDGGVDAIILDPDPLRGGKIVVQAKRYTGTVDVSAVRDLYGTVVNEGATKGILVTTSDYGADSYGFARGKPITLLNGNNLLALLEKHGHEARIDLREAKQNLKARNTGA